MSTYEVRQLVFRGTLQPIPSLKAEVPELFVQLYRHSEKPAHYSIVSQSRHDPDNSPSISMWPYLLASTQTRRFNEISIYAETGGTSDRMRFLYLNDVALEIWGQINVNVQVLGRVYRPPRGSVLAFGMPFSE